jgi:hypothetical protein
VATLFFSYSHVDESLRNQLEKHLAALKRQGLLDTWHDRRILAGQDFGNEIDIYLEVADIILLLVSADFLSSDYCYNREMTRAMERHKAKEAIVIPVILRPCDWHDTPFGRLLAVPKDGLPVSKWPDVDDALLDVVTAIKEALKSHASRTAETQSHSILPTRIHAEGKPIITPVIRSSNLRVKKEFSDYEKDRFLKDGFEYMVKFFENSLHELVLRNPGLQSDFQRTETGRFMAAVYRGGKKVCQCTVFVGAMPGGIAYSHGDMAGANAYNESLVVETDEQNVFFKPILSMSGSREKKLTFEGAADAYWALFLAPIQPRDR